MSPMSYHLGDKNAHVSVDTFSGVAFASAHEVKNIRFTKRHFLLAFAALGISQKIKMDNGPAYKSKQLKTFSKGVKHNTGIPHLLTGQSIFERTHQTLKKVHQRQGGTEMLPPIERLCKTLYFLNCSSSEPTPPVLRYFSNLARSKLKEKPPVLVKDDETPQVSGPFQLITWGRGYTCISIPSDPRCLPGKNIKPYLGPCDTNCEQSV